MTDEELADKYAEEYFGKKTELVEVWKLKSCKDNFLAGLKAGRPQWHDLWKDPTDLPKNRRNVWITYINGYNQRENTEASFRYKYWVISGHRTECEVIAWCEIPTFNKE